MNSNYKSFFVMAFMAYLLSACGSTSVRNDSSGSVAQQKTDRATSTAERRVDQHIDHKINNAIDKLFRKF